MKHNTLWLNLTLAGSMALSGNFFNSPLFAADEENFHYAVALMSDHEEYAAAAEKFREFSDANPEHPRTPSALFYLANCYVKLHKEQTAGEIYEKLYRLYPTHELAEKSLCYAADCYFRAELFARAAELYGQLLNLPNPSSLAATAKYWRAESYARMITSAISAGANPSANDNLDEWYRAAQSDFAAFVKTPHALTADALYSAGALAFDRRDYLTAQALLARLLREYADYAQSETAAYYLAESFYWQNNYVAADQHYAELLAKYAAGKHRAAATAGRGWCAYAQQKFNDAGNFFAAAASDSTSADAGQLRFDAGAAFEEGENFISAQAQFAQVPRDHLRRGAALLRQAIITRKTGNDSEESLIAAEKLLEQADQCNGEHRAETLALLGETRLKLRNFPGAIVACQDAISRYPDSKFTFFAQFQLATALAQSNDFDRAIATLQDLERQNRDPRLHLPALNLLADCEKSRGNSAAAIAAWKQLLSEAKSAAANPELAQMAQDLSARALLNLGETAGDISALTKLQEDLPDSPAAIMARIRLGEIAEKKAAFDEAAKHYEAALIRLASDDSADLAAVKIHTEYRQNVVAVLAANQSTAPTKNVALQTAIDNWQKFQKKYAAQNDAAMWFNRAFYYIAEARSALGNHADALRDYRECYETAPKDELAEAALFGMAWSYHELRNFSAAAKTWQELVAAFPDGEYRAESLFLLTNAKQNLGDTSGAQDTLAQLKKLEPDSDRVQVEEAKIAEKIGDFAVAEKLLTPYLAKPIDHPERARALHALSLLYWRNAEPQLKMAAEREAALKTFLNGRKLRDLPDVEQAKAVELRDQWLQTRNAGRADENQMLLALEKIIADYPDFPGRAAAALRFGESLYERGDFSRAEQCYQQIVTANAADLLDKAYYRLGWCSWRISEQASGDEREKRKQAAIRYFEKVYVNFPDSDVAGESAWQTAEIFRADGDAASAMPAYVAIEKLSTRPEIKSGARYQTAVCLLELKKYRDAFNAFQHFLESVDPTDKTWFAEASWGAGQAAMSLGLFAEARDYFMNAKADNYGGEAAAKARYGLGAIELAQGNLRLAREEFRKVEVFHPGWTEISADALVKAAACSQELGETAVAVKDLRRVLKKYPDASAAASARELLAQLPTDATDTLE